MTAHVRAGVLAFILLVATAPRPQAADPNVDGCARESNPKLKIEYCTRVIESGVYPEGDESWPYVNRCHAENEAGDLALAMQDCDKAI